MSETVSVNSYRVWAQHTAGSEPQVVSLTSPRTPAHPMKEKVGVLDAYAASKNKAAKKSPPFFSCVSVMASCTCEQHAPFSAERQVTNDGTPFLFAGDPDYHFQLDEPSPAPRRRRRSFPRADARGRAASPLCTRVEDLWRYAYRGGLAHAQGQGQAAA